MKCNESRLGFELVSPCPFPTTITITPRASLVVIDHCQQGNKHVRQPQEHFVGDTINTGEGFSAPTAPTKFHPLLCVPLTPNCFEVGKMGGELSRTQSGFPADEFLIVTKFPTDSFVCSLMLSVWRCDNHDMLLWNISVLRLEALETCLLSCKTFFLT